MLSLNHIIGIPKLKEKAKIQILACKNQSTVFPHLLLTGIGGTGKSTFARAIATELKNYFYECEAASFKNREHLLQTLLREIKNAEEKKQSLTIFIDEIHRLNLTLQESLYFPMTECKVNLNNESVNISAFTLIGATTRPDMLDTNSFIKRFKLDWHMGRYDKIYIEQIIANQLRKKEMRFTKLIVQEIAQRSLNIPRTAINLTERVCTLANATKTKVIDINHLYRTFALEEIDSIGLSELHHEYLSILDQTSTHPIGLGAIAAKLRQNPNVIQEMIEPILLELNFVQPTPRGRIITPAGLSHAKKSLTKLNPLHILQVR